MRISYDPDDGYAITMIETKTAWDANLHESELGPSLATLLDEPYDVIHSTPTRANR